MEVTLLKTKKVYCKGWESLHDIMYAEGGRHLEELIDRDSQEVYLFLSSKSIVEDVTWREVINTTSGDDYMCATFRVEEVGIDRYVLKLNDKNIIAFDFSDTTLPQNIEGILPSDYYKVGRMFFESVHWTRDYLEYEARKCLANFAEDKDVVEFLSGYENHKNLQNSFDHNGWQYKYLLSQVKYVRNKYNKDKNIIVNPKQSSKIDYKEFDEWLKEKDNSWAKEIIERSGSNVEFSNFSNFLTIHSKYFNIDNEREMRVRLLELKKQRNMVSHKIGSLVEQEWTDLGTAIENMKYIVDKLNKGKDKDKTLYKCLDKRKEKIIELCKIINGIKQ